MHKCLTVVLVLASQLGKWRWRSAEGVGAFDYGTHLLFPLSLCHAVVLWHGINYSLPHKTVSPSSRFLLLNQKAHYSTCRLPVLYVLQKCDMATSGSRCNYRQGRDREKGKRPGLATSMPGTSITFSNSWLILNIYRWIFHSVPFDFSLLSSATQ